MKILITGGPVHAKLDAVKFITNRFKGGLMAKLALDLEHGPWDTEVKVMYLCSKDSIQPEFVEVVHHDGFHDYRAKVMEMAPDFDAIVLGAAVANLIPVAYYKGYNGRGTDQVLLTKFKSEDWPGDELPMPLEGKFPSHDYKPGDSIFMEWQIAPRIIDEVRPAMKPGAHLFGFKLLSGVPVSELIAAAYDIVLTSKATCVFANEADNLDRVFAVMKDRSVHRMQRDEMPQFILKLMQDEYYSTAIGVDSTATLSAQEKMDGLISCQYFRDKFVEVEGGYVFGSVAVRVGTGRGFLTTERGKRELGGRVLVTDVDHEARIVYTGGGKATLNAPLLYRIFEENPKVDAIVHYHEQDADLTTYPYAPPGTKRDTERPVHTSFNIRNHGCFLLLDKEGRRL